MADRLEQFGRFVVSAVFIAVTLVLFVGETHADDSPPDPPRRETSTHVFTARKNWSIHNGTTWTPSATHEREGLRLRMVGGLESYRYTSRQYDPWTPNGRLLDHAGLRQTLDALAGYQWRIGPWTLKAFTGFHGRRTVIETDDRERGDEWKTTAWVIGPKVAGEAWWHISDTVWASADVSLTSVEWAYASRVRAGWRPHAHWSFGPEAVAAGTLAGVWPSHTQRLGAFARFDNGVHEVSASAGYDLSSHQKTVPYATVQYLYRY